MNVKMYHILRIILYRLWIVSAFTLFSSVLVFWFYGFLLSFVVFILGISGILYNVQDLLLYYPNDPADSRVFVLQPSNYKLPYESIKINNKDGFKIHILSNVSGFYHKLNINILMVEYRGYGLSEGSPSERGLFVDAQSALDYIMQRRDIDPNQLIVFGRSLAVRALSPSQRGLFVDAQSALDYIMQRRDIDPNQLIVFGRSLAVRALSPSQRGLFVDAQSALDYIMQRRDIDPNQLIVFGRSLGGAVAIDVASRIENRNKIWAVVVENTFTSIPDMAKIILKWKCLDWLPNFCHKNKKIGHILTPTLVMCGSNDTLVPPSMAKDLYMRCGAVCKKLVVVIGGGHDDTWTCREYYTSIQNFLVNVPPLPAEVPPYFDEEQKEGHSVVHTV
ncbi:Bem46-like protein [Operophtera brumata]|uniref:Bem46-like protein n=1 Tax=Operophtera brumata TaxID=104452 RepID=A0A0L7LPF7_OPEBR|nr:Bem46-like protein [Operophtera brumata]